MRLSPPGFFYRSWRGEHFLPWQQVQGIEQDAYNLYFLLKSTGPLAGDSSWFLNRTPLFLDRVCLVPRAAFGNPLSADAFGEAATALRGNAHLLPPVNRFAGSGDSEATAERALLAGLWYST